MKKNKMTKIAKYITVIFLVSINAFGQEIPVVKFNHINFVLDPGDLKAIRESSFINETFTAVETKTRKTSSQSSWTVTFLYGHSCYLELFEASGNEATLGVSSIAFSVDKVGELNILKNIFDKTCKTLLVKKERDYDGVKIPWFDALWTIDSTFVAQSHFYFWFMEYKTEYFKYNNYTINNNELTRENYLEKYATERKNKILKRFSGVTMKLSSYEKEYITDFFNKLKYKKIKENQFLLPDNFRFVFKERLSGDQKTIESIEFETSKNFSKKETVKISDNVLITIDGNNGQIIFK